MFRNLGLLVLVPLLLQGCFGSSDEELHAQTFALRLCSLGCSGKGNCATSLIATNQDLVFRFNDQVSPASVSLTSLSMVDILTGSSPNGQFLVNDDTVIFRPALIESNAGVTFGFEESATYQMQLHSSPSIPVIQSVIQRPNTTFLSCSITTAGINDLVPGPPSVVVTPDSTNPPTNSSFAVKLVFNDLMQRAQLLDETTGTSPTISLLVLDDTQASTVEVEVPGTWTISFNQNLLLTTLTFTPLAPFPGGRLGQRVLQIGVDGQVADLSGKLIQNPGNYLIPLPERGLVAGAFNENFNSLSMQDATESTVSLWASPIGALDSGLIPDTGLHRGGGSGALGVFAPTVDVTLNTDSETAFLSVLGSQASITDGVFPFSAVQIPANVTVTAIGLNPLRLFARGELVVDGILDLSGAHAPTNFGKHFPTALEVLAGESVAGVSDSSAVGGQPGAGNAGGGAGGTGGRSWYLLDGAQTLGAPFPPDPDYFDESKQGYTDPAGPDPTRFSHGLRWLSIHGQIGQGLGGLNGQGLAAGTTGNPEDLVSGSDIVADRDQGGGIGTWAWPPASDTMLDTSFAATHTIAAHQDSGTGAFLNYSIHRSRGGGGGGYWTDGLSGEVDAVGSTNPLGLSLPAPVVDADLNSGIHEYNNNVFAYDARMAGLVVDGAGGDPDLAGRFSGIETLDPSSNLLLGGSGGGGAGVSQHGSWSDDPTSTAGAVDTYRSCSGAGGGAGGGALQLHAGDRLSITGSVNLVGGIGGDSDFMVEIPFPDTNLILFGPPGDAGGGGGSGGALLLQAGGSLDIDSDADEEILLDGGRGGLGSVGNHGGDGGSGVVRFETPTGTESLALLQSWVSPDAATDLSSVGSPGLPNLVPFSVNMPGSAGDVGIFNLNSSGVTSRWFEPSNTIFLVDYTSWTLTCEFDTGTGPQSLVFSDTATSTTPGTTPVWVGFQVGWGSPGSGQPDSSAISDWVVPGGNTATGGLEELRSFLGRMLRFQLVFDQDIVAALIGSDPSAYFRVTDLQFTWQGE